MPLTLPEKRLRNRSICTLYTPPPYPGYSATRASLTPNSLSLRKQSSTDMSPGASRPQDSLQPGPLGDSSKRMSRSCCESGGRCLASSLLSPFGPGVRGWPRGGGGSPLTARPSLQTSPRRSPERTLMFASVVLQSPIKEETRFETTFSACAQPVFSPSRDAPRGPFQAAYLDRTPSERLTTTFPVSTK